MVDDRRAEILVEALPYIRRFRGATVVVKYGGNAMVDPDLAWRTEANAVVGFREGHPLPPIEARDDAANRAREAARIELLEGAGGGIGCGIGIGIGPVGARAGA